MRLVEMENIKQFYSKHNIFLRICSLVTGIWIVTTLIFIIPIIFVIKNKTDSLNSNIKFEVNSAISNRSLQALEGFSDSLELMLNSTHSKIDFLSNIFLSDYKEEPITWNRKLAGSFVLEPIKASVPNFFTGMQISSDKKDFWSYALLGDKYSIRNQKEESPELEKIINSTSLLNYFTKDLIFDESISKIRRFTLFLGNFSYIATYPSKGLSPNFDKIKSFHAYLTRTDIAQLKENETVLFSPKEDPFISSSSVRTIKLIKCLNASQKIFLSIDILWTVFNSFFSDMKITSKGNNIYFLEQNGALLNMPRGESSFDVSDEPVWMENILSSDSKDNQIIENYIYVKKDFVHPVVKNKTFLVMVIPYSEAFEAAESIEKSLQNGLGEIIKWISLIGVLAFFFSIFIIWLALSGLTNNLVEFNKHSRDLLTENNDHKKTIENLVILKDQSVGDFSDAIETFINAITSFGGNLAHKPKRRLIQANKLMTEMPENKYTTNNLPFKKED